MGSYGSWALAAMGLLGVTYGLEQILRGNRTKTSIGAAALAAPLAVGGLVGWTLALLQEARR